VLAVASAGAGLAAVGLARPGRAGDVGVAACDSIPPTADPNVIKVVYQVGTGLGADGRVMLAGFEAGWVESHMNNLPCGDSDSLGVFQQRPSQGWGIPEQIMNVAYAANSFFTRAITVAANHPGWTAGQVAQGVQRSAFPDRYDAAQAIAQQLIERARDLVAPPQPGFDTWKDTMKLIQSTGRGIALVDAGYFRGLRNEEEVHAAVMLVGNPRVGNDRQFDVWKSIAYDGQVKP
jgi:hypothetical protein